MTTIIMLIYTVPFTQAGEKHKGTATFLKTNEIIFERIYEM